MNATIAIVLAGGLLVLAWILGRPWLARRRRRAIFARGLDVADRSLLARAWPRIAELPVDLRERLERLAAVFVAEKEFVGCGDLAITEPMRLAIAAQACLLVLGERRHVYDRLHAVLVYPSRFVAPSEWEDEHGVVTSERRELSGEAWDLSRILLSWEDVDSRGAPGEAYNVVIHEFAHYLDEESGGADGVPALPSAADRARWQTVIAESFAALRRSVEAGEPTFLDPYAAENEAEYFAVASEAFFEEPREFARRLPALYEQFRGYYRLDPAAW